MSMGEPAVGGAESIKKILATEGTYECLRPVVGGDGERLREAGAIAGVSLQVNSIQEVAQAGFKPGTVDCIDLKLIPPGQPFGQLSPLCGDAAYRYIERAVQLTKDKEIDAICTAQLNKEALHAGGNQ